MRVHVVDDNETNILLFEQLALRVSPDVEVRTFLDPVLALEACRQALPDLIIVDYMMPGMDGHQYVEAVRGLPGAKDVPIIMATAAAERSVRQRALELGVSDFLIKPVDPSEVRARLGNLLALRRSHLQLKDRNRWLADEVRKATAMVVDREQELVWRLSKAAEFRDPETGGHIVRMAHFSRLIAQGLKLETATCDLLLRAAPMHDLGKLGIPDGILLKPARLSPDEFIVMSQHPRIGYEILKDSTSQLIRMGAEIALSHHEKWDGTGYPNKLAGEAIPLLGRIVAVADVFDALTSARPYKGAWPVEKARDYLVENAGSHFDPACIAAFLAAWDEVQSVRNRFVDEDSVPELL